MDRVIRLGVLNIVTQPHSADTYQNLIVRTKNRRKAARIRGERFGVISTSVKSTMPSKPGSYVEGSLTTFTQIDVDGDWVNVSTGKKAEEDEVVTINIPKNLRPNPEFHRYRFFLNEHVLIFEIGNSGNKLTPINAGKLFERLFSADKIEGEFGEVAVTVWPERGTLKRILGSSSLSALHLKVFAPNPDDGAEAEKRILARLEAMNARYLDEQYRAKKGQAMNPDKELRETALVASKNGFVEGSIKEEGRIIHLSTVDRPFVYTHSYNNKVNTEADSFGIACEIVRHQLRDG